MHILQTSKIKSVITMILISVSIIFLIVCKFDEIESKGLFDGVPCHRSYHCIFEENDDGFENSVLIAEEEGVEREKNCQMKCANLEGCVSYSWWNEEAIDHPDGNPYLCQMFSACHRRYHVPHFTPVFSGRIVISF